MRRDDISTSNGAHTSVGGKDNDRSKGRFEGSVEESETFNIEHMDFIDE